MRRVSAADEAHSAWPSIRRKDAGLSPEVATHLDVLSRRLNAAGSLVVEDQPLRPRRMQTVRVAITDAAGMPVENATIEIDGGMPEHGHGLPTRPRMTRALGNGLYEIEGVRFNMGGWWEFKLVIDAASRSDVVTFNLAL